MLIIEKFLSQRPLHLGDYWSFCLLPLNCSDTPIQVHMLISALPPYLIICCLICCIQWKATIKYLQKQTTSMPSQHDVWVLNSATSFVVALISESSVELSSCGVSVIVAWLSCSMKYLEIFTSCLLGHAFFELYKQPKCLNKSQLILF